MLAHVKEPGPRVEQISKRRPPQNAQNVVTVALANRMARPVWALLAHNGTDEGNYADVKPMKSVRRFR